MQVEASVDEADIGQVRQSQPVRFTVDAYPGETFAATVRQIRKSATELQSVVSYLVILDVDNKGGKLLPGMTANVEIITGIRTNVVRVPTSALRFRPRTGDRPAEKDLPSSTPMMFVATADPFRPQRRVVKVGLEGEDYVEIVKGVRPGEKLVLRSKSTVKKKAVEDSGDGTDDADGG
jgi:HlyD family secretion protein